MNERYEYATHLLSPALRRKLGIITLATAPLLAACGPTETKATSSQPITTSEVITPHASHETVDERELYPLHKDITATVYWIGEGATADNGHISNVPSAWSSDAVKDFGGVDTPGERSFVPKHNTFYVALPAAEFNESGLQEGVYDASPWANEARSLKEGESLFKGRWVKLSAGDHTSYAQWQDVGPCADEQPECLTDYDYVFGDKQPINTFGQKAGIDLSPDAAKLLDLNGSGKVTWGFVDGKDVPNGPWKTYPAITSQTNW
jgi:hypothetical protein